MEKSLSANDLEQVRINLEAPGAAPAARPPRATEKSKNRAAGVRTWLKIDSIGESTVVQMDKYKIQHELGVQLRDLRILDPNLATSYPSAILCRDKALVVNLEHIKVLITTQFVLVNNAEEAPVTAFIDELKKRLSNPHMPVNLSYPALHTDHLSATGKKPLLIQPSVNMHSGVIHDMSFELRALEVCLEQVASLIDRQTSDLEGKAHSALDQLTSKVTAPNLELVRRIKSRITRLTTRAVTIRELLEKFLDDDKDMRDMNLTAKQAAEHHAAQEEELHHSISSRSSGDNLDEDVAPVEMLLEAYFMQVDNSWNRLQTLKEYIDDTEDLINIELDQHRNQLISIDLLLTAGTFTFAMIGVITGIFGMNLTSHLEENHRIFLAVVISITSIAACLFGTFLFLCWRYKILFF